MTPPESTVESPAPKKRTVKEFLKQYRAMGLPGAKRFRRRTRLEEAAHQNTVHAQMNTQLIRMVAAYKKAFAQLSDEKNWAVRGEDVLWVGESDPLEIIRKVGV